MKLLKDGDKITFSELEKIVGIYGGGHVSVEGGWPFNYTSLDEVEFEGSQEEIEASKKSEIFVVRINYGYEVQFWSTAQTETYITTGLKGICVNHTKWIGWLAEVLEEGEISFFKD